jgi:uncharacterized membrane protein YhaH (DUF805 family)
MGVTETPTEEGNTMKYYLLAFKKYGDFSGRATRTEYWMFNLVHAIVLLFLYFGAFGSSIFETTSDPYYGTYEMSTLELVFMLLYYAYSLGVLIANLALTVRRLHDIGRSGFWYFISFIPFLGGLIMLIFMILPSQTEGNRFGPAHHFNPEVFA